MSNETENVIAVIEEYAVSLLEDRGLELVEVQFRRESHGWVLRLFIDSDKGITVDDCVAVSRGIGSWLDVEELIEQAYHLEVSSPGVERPLKKPADFERFAGRKARIKLKEPRDERRVFIGILESVQENDVTLIVDEKPVTLFFEEISKARLVL